MDLLKTLTILRPGQSLGFDNGKTFTLSNVSWYSQRTYTGEEVADMDDTSHLLFNEEANVYTEAPFTIPTQAECEEYWNSTLKNQLALETLRRKRDSTLDKTDKYATIDYPHASEEVKQAWLDYRQALRDLPANTEDPAAPVWPEAPQ
jgi:hypothetical protein